MRTKLFTTIAVLILLPVVGFYGLRFYLGSIDETDTNFRATFQQASRDIEVGWLPDFLPASAKNIREKHNMDTNQGIIAFEFAPSDFKHFSPLLKRVSQERFRNIRPSWLRKYETWFPSAIAKGELEQLRRQGFEIYEIGTEYAEKIVNGKIQKWFLAVNQDEGIAYIWH